MSDVIVHHFEAKKNKNGVVRFYNGRNPIPTEPRFWLKVDRRGPNECWLWTGTTNQRELYR